jgi:hypothetical protein
VRIGFGAPPLLRTPVAECPGLPSVMRAQRAGMFVHAYTFRAGRADPLQIQLIPREIRTRQ